MIAINWMCFKKQNKKESLPCAAIMPLKNCALTVRPLSLLERTIVIPRTTQWPQTVSSSPENRQRLAIYHAVLSGNVTSATFSAHSFHLREFEITVTKGEGKFDKSGEATESFLSLLPRGEMLQMPGDNK